MSKINALLSAATDTVLEIAKSNGLESKKRKAIRAMMIAADALYDAAEMIANGQPSGPDECGHDLLLALWTARAKMEEAGHVGGVDHPTAAVVDWAKVYERGEEWEDYAWAGGGESCAPAPVVRLRLRLA